MSGRLPDSLAQLQGGNGLMPRRPQPIQMPVRRAMPLHHRVRNVMAPLDQQAMIQKRDTAGKEMQKLAEIASDPEPNRADVVAYIGGLTKVGQITPDEAAQILQGLPQQPQAIKQWAKNMFGVMMHVGIHAEAAYPRALFPGAQNAPSGAAAAGAEESDERADDER